MISGFVNVNKPREMTSSDVVCIVRGIFSRAVGERCKAGHTGTLDPLASGVLPIALGKAARLFDYLLAKKKRYTATFAFGSTTDTLDSDGRVTESGGKIPSCDEIVSVLPEFTGETEQIPPAYSAKSVGGKRAYDLARQGKEFSLTPRKVVIDSLSVAPAESNGEFTFDIVCGAGTYIRALARDIASRLGTVAHMTSLVRTESGIFALSDAVTLDELRLDPLSHVLPVDFPLAENPRVILDGERAALAANGVAVVLAESGERANAAEVKSGEKNIAVYAENGVFLGMGALDGTVLKMRAVLC